MLDQTNMILKSSILLAGLASFSSVFVQHQHQKNSPCDFQFFPSQLTLNMGIHKASRTRDFSIRPHNPAWDLSSHLCPSLTSSLCHSIPPSPSETVLPAICHVMFMGPFAFVSWWPLSQRATHYRCGLMNDVTQTLCWHLCVLGRRDAAAPARSGQ